MRQYDLSPLYRSSVGFDRLFTILDQMSGVDASAQTYPPYNIDLSIETRENVLLIRGARKPDASEAPKTEVLYQGIAARAFERRFQLADHVQVTGAALEHGLLHVDLVREIPEAQKPRQIPIGKGVSAAPRVVEASKAA